MQCDTITLNTAISTRARNKEWELAVAVLQELSAQSIEKDEITHGAVLSACDRGAKWEAAVGVLVEMDLSSVRESSRECQSKLCWGASELNPWATFSAFPARPTFSLL